MRENLGRLDLFGKLLIKHLKSKPLLLDSNYEEIRLIVLSACHSEIMGIELQIKLRKTVIIAIDKNYGISFESAKKFTKELYTYLYNTAG